jgi:hypothetical protein
MSLELYTAYNKAEMIDAFGEDLVGQLDAETPTSEATEGNREFRASLVSGDQRLVALYYSDSQPLAGSPDHYVVEPNA